jgi:hypothetical protein
MTYTEKAVKELRYCAKYINDNAENLLGDLDETYISENGVRLSFEMNLEDGFACVLVKVEKDHLVYNKEY